jgi:hypothetical protein
MSPFVLFWVLVAADLLNPVPMLAGITVGAVAILGRIKATFAVFSAAISIMLALAFLRNDDFAAYAYAAGAQFLAMTAWITFVVALILITREVFSNQDDDRLLPRRVAQIRRRMSPTRR